MPANATTSPPYVSGLLARARTAGEMRVALRIVVEGLQATRVVREHLGLALGPELPDVTGPATVQAPTPVNIGDQQITAHPDYHPDSRTTSAAAPSLVPRCPAATTAPRSGRKP
jgi:hypothetical protein